MPERCEACGVAFTDVELDDREQHVHTDWDGDDVHSTCCLTCQRFGPAVETVTVKGGWL